MSRWWNRSWEELGGNETGRTERGGGRRRTVQSLIHRQWEAAAAHRLIRASINHSAHSLCVLCVQLWGVEVTLNTVEPGLRTWIDTAGYFQSLLRLIAATCCSCLDNKPHMLPSPPTSPAVAQTVALLHGFGPSRLWAWDKMVSRGFQKPSGLVLVQHHNYFVVN